MQAEWASNVKQPDIGNKFEKGIPTIECNSEKGNSNHGKCEMYQPLPVELKQKGQHQQGRRCLEVNSQRQGKRRKEWTIPVQEDGQENEIDHMQIDLHIH